MERDVFFEDHSDLPDDLDPALRAKITEAEQAPPAPGSLPSDITEELARLAALHPVAYEQERKAAAKRLGIRRVSTLDREVERLRAPDAVQSAGSGRPLDLSPPEPWPEPVNLAVLLAELRDLFTRYLALPDHAAEALALWVVHTYVADASFITPRLAITSPEKRCGKSTLLELVAAVACKSLIASNITAPALFRTVEIARPTLFIDEADTFLRENEELRGVLNSGHGQSGSVIRTVEVNGEHEPRRFSTWCPVAIALIGELPGTLADRSITISMRRKGPGETKERYRRDRPEQFQPLARRCARWAKDNRLRLSDQEPEVPVGLHDRAADNWRPLLAIAELAGDAWARTARKAALALSGAVDDAEASLKVALLADIREFWSRAEVAAHGRLPTQRILDELNAREDRPWGELSHGKPLTPHKLARLLKPYGIQPIHEEKFRGYDKASFADAWARYLSPEPNDGFKASVRQNGGNFNGLAQDTKRQTNLAPDAFAGELSDWKSEASDGLTLSNPDASGEGYQEGEL